MEHWLTTRNNRRKQASFLSVLMLGALLAAAGHAQTNSQALEFFMDGELRGKKTVAELEQLPSKAVLRVFEPYEGQAVEFRAVPLNAVLDAVYGESWRDRDEVLLTCRDGYQPSFPVSRLLAFDAWLAVDRIDSEGFSILKLERGARTRVDLSPFYLVWDNLSDMELRAQGDYGWPYQLVGLDLIDAHARFPLMTPPGGAGESVAAGFAAFRMHCTRCHKINGEGGTIGPELNSPVNATEFRETAWLTQWIDNPASLLATARMPRLNPNLKDRKRLIDDLIAYLSEMSKHKIPVAEPTGNGS